jgi:hypothetical protein
MIKALANSDAALRRRREFRVPGEPISQQLRIASLQQMPVIQRRCLYIMRLVENSPI